MLVEAILRGLDHNMGRSIAHTHFHIASQPVTVLPLRSRASIAGSEMIMPRRTATDEPREPTKHRRQKTPLQGSTVGETPCFASSRNFDGVSFVFQKLTRQKRTT